jgi:hypothetical protein
MNRILLCSTFSTILFCGCAARIDSVQVSTVQEGQPIPVAVDVTPFMTTVLPPETFTRDDVPGSLFQQEGNLSNSGNHHYTGNLAPRNYGAHHFRVEVPYRLPLVPGTSRRSAERKFLVDAPAGCFAFDGVGAEGWRVRGIFDGGDPSTQISTCGPIDIAAITTAAANWPEPAPGHAGLAMPLGPGCFPNTASSGFWAFDFISPNLENRTGWAGQNAFTFRINSFDALIVPNGLQVQALLRVRKPDGTEAFFRQLNPNGQPRFEIVPAGWSQFSWQFDVPAGSVPLSIHIRIFGVPAVRSSDIAVQIDGVCPGL